MTFYQGSDYGACDKKTLTALCYTCNISFGVQSNHKTTSLLGIKLYFLILQEFYLDTYVYHQYTKSFEKYLPLLQKLFTLFFYFTIFQ